MCCSYRMCNVVGYYPIGDHVWVVGEVLLAAVEPEGFTVEEGWHEDVQLLFSLRRIQVRLPGEGL